MAHQVLPEVPLPQQPPPPPRDDWDCHHGGDCLGDSDECGFCPDERCISAHASEAGWSDADHCGNGCPLQADRIAAEIAANPSTFPQNELATYMARHPDRVNPAMWAVYAANIARENAEYMERQARIAARRLDANNAVHP